jgi:amino acid adenylation domain-containing protein
MVITMLGILKAGCAYIPIDPEYPKERIDVITQDSDARFIITDTGEHGFDAELSLTELFMTDDTGRPNVRISANDLAYLIFTSGSTGRPKGVMVSNGNIINYVLPSDENRHIKALIDADARMLSITTISFDMSLKEIFTTLLNGLSVIIADENATNNPELLADIIVKKEATAFNATPSRMMQYLASGSFSEALSACKVILAGAESYPPVLFRKLREIAPGAVLINTYGPTEATVSANAKILSGDVITAGAPLSNVIERIVDIHDRDLPPGIIGELLIGGYGVTQGYIGRDDLTREKFITFGGEGDRYYRTGDLAKVTPDGEIRIIGRNDNQIKLRGLRIELGEVESVIASAENITKAVVVIKSIQGFEHLCAYFTADKYINTAKLREEISGKLAAYMVPTAYMQLESFSLNPNGKIDLRALPEPVIAANESYEAPRDAGEELICSIFAKALHLEKVGALDDFFALGGTSLLVTQISIDAKKAGLGITYADVFKQKTPRALDSLQKKLQNHTDDYDYTAINKALEKNTIDALISGQRHELGNICITGATGFLGIHILHDFLLNETGVCYGIVRGNRVSAENRLKSMLMYYFDDSYDELFGSRIFVIDGDVTETNVWRTLEEHSSGKKPDVVINCAAIVKHFSAGTEIEDINVGGVRKGLAFAKKTGCRFVQISTASVAGESVGGVPDVNSMLTEQTFYFGQNIDNQYVHSKFIAERLVLEAIADGVSAKIMRAGNLMARNSEGYFLANFYTNSFVGRLRALEIIGKAPYEMLSHSTEFAPIDCTARAILLLATSPDENTVFHPYNTHDVYYSDILEIINKDIHEIKTVENSEFEVAFGDAVKKGHAALLSALVAYQSDDRAYLHSDAVFIEQALFRYGFKWPLTSEAYLNNFINYLKDLGFFDEQ